MGILTSIAQIIGFAVLLFIALMILMTVGHTVHDFIRAKFPKYDMWLYDDVHRQNRKRRHF